jgi:hypothetical protein
MQNIVVNVGVPESRSPDNARISRNVGVPESRSPDNARISRNFVKSAVRRTGQRLYSVNLGSFRTDIDECLHSPRYSAMQEL